MTSDRDEVAREISPKGDLDAVLIEIHGGATTGFGYEVHVVPHGGKASARDEAAYFYDAERNKNAYGVRMRWRGSDTLAVEYLKAESADLKRATVPIQGRTVVVQLFDGVVDETAPQGSMLHNLERRPSGSR